MSSKPKLVEALRSVVVVEACLFVVGLTLLLVRELPLSMAKNVPTPIGRLGMAVGVALFCIVIIEVASWRIRSTLAMRSSNIRKPERNVYGLYATFDQYRDIIQASFWILLLLIIDSVIVYIVSRNRFTLTAELGAYVAVFPIWLVVRRPVLSTLGKLLDSGQPSYEIAPTGDAVLITRIAGQRKGRGPIRIGFEELSEIRVLNIAEAEAFREYELGPNVELGIQQTKDLIDYGRGKISRPSVYTIGSDGSIGNSVLMRGPGLFYWLRFRGQDGSDILAAWARYRGESPAAGRAPA